MTLKTGSKSGMGPEHFIESTQGMQHTLYDIGGGGVLPSFDKMLEKCTGTEISLLPFFLL